MKIEAEGVALRFGRPLLFVMVLSIVGELFYFCAKWNNQIKIV